ncbi:hypothetical protein TomTYG45_09430 [Sphingobium sp. TomTYG45]
MEYGAKEASHILYHDRAWAGRVNNVESVWEQVAFVPLSKLFASERERRAGESTCYKVDAFKIGSPLLENPEIVLDNVPGRAIGSEGRTATRINLDQCLMLEPRFF